jgi:F0F1-type ATP synthase delta subunit
MMEVVRQHLIIAENYINSKLKELTNAREIRLVITVDPNLIGGFLIKTDQVIDFTIKNQLQQLAKHLDTVLEIYYKKNFY